MRLEHTLRTRAASTTGPTELADGARETMCSAKRVRELAGRAKGTERAVARAQRSVVPAPGAGDARHGANDAHVASRFVRRIRKVKVPREVPRGTHFAQARATGGGELATWTQHAQSHAFLGESPWWASLSASAARRARRSVENRSKTGRAGIAAPRRIAAAEAPRRALPSTSVRHRAPKPVPSGGARYARGRRRRRPLSSGARRAAG